MQKADMDLSALDDYLKTISDVEKSIISMEVDNGVSKEKHLARVSEETKLILSGAQDKYIKAGGDIEGFRDEVLRMVNCIV